MFKQLNIETKLVCLIIFTIGMQQFPVIRVGGSFKIYELLAMCLLFISLFSLSKVRFINFFQLYAFGFFVLSPVLSLLYAYIILDYPNGFFLKYPGAVESFKFNYWVFPILQLIYMCFNFATINYIVKSEKLFGIFKRVLKITIWIGAVIALYSIFAMFVVDIIAKLPSFIQFKQEYQFRSSGLSQEPSFYVLYQAWVVFIAFYSKKLFSNLTWIGLFSINAIALLFTFSTTLVALILVILMTFFFLKNPPKIKIFILVGLALFIGGLYILLLNSSNYNYLETFFINKLANFFSAPQHTLDSGSYRSYTTRIGFEIFKKYPLFGVGVGNSIYYMYLFQNKMGILVFGERLFAGSFPQNGFSMVLSEQGIVGGVFFLLFLIKMFLEFWKYRNHDNYCRMFFIGYLFNVAALMTIAPLYSLFIWIFPALGIGYIKHIVKD